MESEHNAAPRARLLIADGVISAHRLGRLGYSRLFARNSDELLSMSRDRTLNVDAFLIHYRLGGEGTAAMVREIRNRNRRCAIMVYTHLADVDIGPTRVSSTGMSQLEELRRELLLAQADLFLHRFNLVDPTLVSSTLELLLSTRRTRIDIEWERRSNEFAAAASVEDTWVQAVDRVMSWLEDDGYVRGRFFHRFHAQDQHECVGVFGHSPEERQRFRFRLEELSPVFDVIRNEGVSRWSRSRLEALFADHGRKVPELLRHIYFSSESEFPWVYVSLVHGDEVIGNISLDRSGTTDPAITQIDGIGLDYFRRKIPDVLQRLWQREERIRGKGIAAAPSVAADTSPEIVEMVHEDPDVRQLLDRVEAVAQLTSPVLITGETGAGKEVLARRIHEASNLRHRGFLPVNCAAMIPSLSNELFGSLKGAFTDATDRPGYFEAVRGGTLFLDEIGDLDREIQGRLLRVLETGEIVRVGDTTPRRVAFRLICATNKDLQHEVRQGRFRLDLYFRIARHRFDIPPLRRRPLDVRAYVDQVVNRFRSLAARVVDVSPEAWDVLLDDQWPGNFRQLQSALRGALILLGTGSVLTPELLQRTGMVGLHLSASGPDQVGEADDRTSIGDVEGASPRDQVPDGVDGSHSGGNHSGGDYPGSRQSRARCHAILEDLKLGRGTFWELVYEPFRSHSLPRTEVLMIVEHGLRETRGSYKQTVRLFNMDPDKHYKRFMDFLRSNSLWIDYRPFRGQRMQSGKSRLPPQNE